MASNEAESAFRPSISEQMKEQVRKHANQLTVVPAQKLTFEEQLEVILASYQTQQQMQQPTTGKTTGRQTR